MSAVLTAMPTRWTTLRRHAMQQSYWRSVHRFNCVHAGRRSGKTEIAKRRLVRRALDARTTWAPRFFAGAPTRDQAKRIFWEDLKALIGKDMMRKKPSEEALTCYLSTGADVVVLGLDVPERIEGSPWDGGVLTEMGNMKPDAWPKHVRPALSDRNGWCDLEGVPEGRNHYYDLDQKALAMMQELGAKSEWASFTWESAEILPASEIEAAMRDLDELTFDQEYRGSFISFEGRAYYPYMQASHTAPLKYDPRGVLNFCFDFNVEPGVSSILQEQALPGQYAHGPRGEVYLDRPLIGTGIIGEVHIPRNSNTPAVCRRLVKDWGKHQGPVRCYGDATGGSRGSAKVEGSDWELIEKELRPTFRDRLTFRVKDANPAERARINAVNSRFKSILGDIRMMIDLSKAPNVAKDFDGVTLLKGGSGEIDKKIAPLLTHHSDAIGYYVDYEYPVVAGQVQRVQIGGV